MDNQKETVFAGRKFHLHMANLPAPQWWLAELSSNDHVAPIFSKEKPQIERRDRFGGVEDQVHRLGLAVHHQHAVTAVGLQVHRIGAPLHDHLHPAVPVELKYIESSLTVL